MMNDLEAMLEEHGLISLLEELQRNDILTLSDFKLLDEGNIDEMELTVGAKMKFKKAFPIIKFSFTATQIIYDIIEKLGLYAPIIVSSDIISDGVAVLDICSIYTIDDDAAAYVKLKCAGARFEDSAAIIKLSAKDSQEFQIKSEMIKKSISKAHSKAL